MNCCTYHGRVTWPILPRSMTSQFSCPGEIVVFHRSLSSHQAAFEGEGGEPTIFVAYESM